MIKVPMNSQKKLWSKINTIVTAKALWIFSHWLMDSISFFAIGFVESFSLSRNSSSSGRKRAYAILLKINGGSNKVHVPPKYMIK
mmetsp:Transcript_12855/g.35627  ORF Transcript_12855/g.35627 Transcript_12855/m.35627 type:complete len:85 (-) Transcript_12855:38-292(-)